MFGDCPLYIVRHLKVCHKFYFFEERLIRNPKKMHMSMKRRGKNLKLARLVCRDNRLDKIRSFEWNS